jgi:Tol biopolymer transport system component
MTRLIDGNDGGWYPTWTQDGERIVFVSDREGTTAATLFSRSADGTGPVESLNIDLPDDTAVLVPGSWSPDGLLASVLVRTGGRDFDEDIALVSLGDPELTFLFESDAIEREPAISPRGGWIAYVSDRDGPSNVYVERFPGGGGRIQISTEGGRSPLWSGEGELFYRRLSDGAVMVVAFGSEERFEPRDVSVLIEGDYRVGSNVRDYDYDSENQRFLMIKETTVSDSTPVETDGAPGRTRIRVVENFVEELKERVPVP